MEPERQSALHIAAMWGHERVVKLLLNYGATVDLRNQRHETPLLVAAKEGHPDVIQVLLEHMADVDDVDAEYNTALHLASTHPHVISLLLRNGAHVNAVNSQGRTSIHEASKRGDTRVVGILLENSTRDMCINAQGEYTDAPEDQTDPRSDDSFTQNENSYVLTAPHESDPHMVTIVTSRVIDVQDEVWIKH